MKARVTGKLARGRDNHGREVVINKHTSCTICGWQLKSSDRETDEKKSQRMLYTMPDVIFLKFEKVDWQLTDTEKGAWPLKSVRRRWELSENGSKVTRHGFTLVPDYASTGFTCRGETLEAAIAECGDITTTARLTEVLTTYVILSRVKRADRLLLLRAFSPNMFKFGTPPGPKCLLKQSKHRLWLPAGKAKPPVDSDGRERC